jgi:O-antigen/teichoic acid export membrane protein
MSASLLEFRNLLRNRLAQGAAGTLGLMLINTLLMFLSHLLLARWLGATEYGRYSYVLIWLNLLSIPALLGLDRLLVREVSIYRAKLEWGFLSGLLRWANLLGGGVSLGLAVLVLGLVWAFSRLVGQAYLQAFAVGIWALPFMTLLDIRRSALRGFDNIIAGQLPEMLIRPLLIILFIGLVALGWRPLLNSNWALLAVVLAHLFAFFYSDWQLRKTVRPLAPAAPVYRPRIWLISAVPLMTTVALATLNEQTSAQLLGMLKSPADVGVFGVANYLARTLTFILIAVNTALAPTVANLYAVGDFARLQSVAIRIVRAVLFVAVPLASVLLLGGGYLLRLFGPEFAAGRTALTILCLSQLANCALGPVGLLLLMTGHERDTVIVMGQAFFLNVVLGFILIPLWNIEGAALASATAVVFWNVILTRRVHQRLGIRVNLFGPAPAGTGAKPAPPASGKLLKP